MFGFEKNMPLQAFLGSTIWWVSFGVNALSLKLENSCKIIVYDRKEFYRRQSVPTLFNDAKFIECVGLNVTNVCVKSEGLLTISIGTNTILHFWDLEKDFENYEFIINDQHYTV